MKNKRTKARRLKDVVASKGNDPIIDSSAVPALFLEQSNAGQRSSSFVLSALIHVTVPSLAYFAMLNMPRADARVITERYAVRHIDLHAPQTEPEHSARASVAYPDLQGTGLAGAGNDGAGVPSALSIRVPQLQTSQQTLVQPDLPPNLSIPQEAQVPALMVWSAQKTVVKSIVLPAMKRAVNADVHPSLEAPNEELKLSDVRIASTENATAIHPVLPSTTSPIVAPNPEQPRTVPATTADSPQAPTPTAVLSVSELRMKEGMITIPPGNETSSVSSPGLVAPQPPGHSLASQEANSLTRANDIGVGHDSTNTGDKQTGVRSTAKQDGQESGQVQVSGSGSGTISEFSSVHITLPRDGKFGAVVVGSSIAERYPETAEIWAGRLTYTVYLHLGQAKSWILQYSLPRLNDAAASGNTIRLEAPWPYSIVRPDISIGSVDADALMVHGFVNRDGRFESLSVAFPTELPRAQDLLNTLEQWQFRPATQNGEIAKVEILLVIPEDPQ
jgi:hypothetical protein